GDAPGGPRPHLQGGRDEGRRRVDEGVQAGCRGRQAVCDRVGGHGDPDRHAGLRRQRLHGGVPRRPVLPRRQDPRDRRGHLRGAADGHRPRAGPARMTPPPVYESDPRVADVRARLHEAYETSGKISDKARAKLDSQNKIYVRDRIGLLFDEGSFVEDGRFANATADGLPADGVVTGRGSVDGRPAIVIATDPAAKAGSWGARTVEKIVRATEMALREELPVFWFVDSAGARITDQ